VNGKSAQTIGARLCCTCFRRSRYLSTVPNNPLRPGPNHSATDSQSFGFIVKIFSRPTHARGVQIRSRLPWFWMSDDRLFTKDSVTKGTNYYVKYVCSPMRYCYQLSIMIIIDVYSADIYRPPDISYYKKLKNSLTLYLTKCGPT
jgi:hypothetical protein